MSKYDVILDVYENQSISKAAQKHNYTQSAVSQTIRNYGSTSRNRTHL